jgi:hypothetical protein
MQQVSIYRTRKFGLDVFKVYLNKTLVAEFMSENGARNKANELRNKLTV